MSKIIEVIKPTRVLKPGESISDIPKRRVCAYARVSTDYEDQLNSYKVQCEEYTKVIESNPNYIFSGLFADQGLSGTQAKKRPEFMKMINSAKEGNIDLILTKSISRFGRNTVDVITYIRELREIGVEIFFEKENISSLDPKIDFMLTILSSIAQEESRAISTNVKWSYDKKFQRGIVDPRRIYGYEISDGKQVIKEDEAIIVRKIFNLAMKRYNINDIVKTLNSEGIKSLKDKAWTYSAIKFMLSNEKYIGDALLRKTVCIDYLTKKTVKNDNIADKYYVSNNHEAIVDKETFEAVNLILSDKSNSVRNLNKTTKYPLTGILYCPKCGRSLKRQHILHKGSKTITLNCNHSYGNEHICSTSSPRYDLVLEATTDSIKEIYANDLVLNNLFDVFDSNVALNSLRHELETLKDNNKQLHSLLTESPDNKDLINQINHNDIKIDELQKELSINLSSSVRLEYIKSLVKDEYGDFNDIKFKDVYSLILADEQKITFVISPIKPINDLLNEIPEIKNHESLLSKMYVAKDGLSGIYYEVKIYE